MTAKYPYRLSVIVTGLLIMLFASTAWAVPSKWTCGTGDYSTLTCWNPQLKEPPYNRGVLTFDVTIEADDSTISMDLDVVPCEVNSLILGTSKAVADHPATLKVLGGGGRTYSVLDQACIYGRIHVDGGAFLAPHGSFCGNKAQVWVDAKGYVLLGAPAYDSTGIWHSWDADSGTDDDSGTWAPVLMKASGQESLLDLSSVQSIDAGFNSAGNDHTYQQILAEQGGKIDLSRVKTIVAPSSGRDRIDIVMKGPGSSIDLQGLEAIVSGYHGWYYGHGTATIENAGGHDLNLASLVSIDQVAFVVSGGSAVNIPSIGKLTDSTFVISNGSALLDGSDGSATYSSLDIWRSWDADSGTDDDSGTWSPVLMKASGQGSILDLSSIQSIDAGFNSAGNDHTYQQIIAEQGGRIDLSGVKTIVAPSSARDHIELHVSAGGLLDLSSLQTVSSATGSGTMPISLSGASHISLGDVRFDEGTAITLNGASVLHAQGMRASKPTTITLNDSDDLLVVRGDFDLGTAITVLNPGKAGLALGGDFTHAHKDLLPKKGETKVPFGKSYVHLNGEGPQEVEVGGYDADVLIEELVNDNFGFGQMSIGRNDPNAEPTAVLLVDRVDNGNTPGLFGNEKEALYLFGKDGQDGLRILNGSTLFMGGLKVYAMIGGKITDLRTLFGPGEVKIPFDEGYLCLDKPRVGDPGNLVCNGGFETGVNPPTAETCMWPLAAGSTDIECWVVDQNGVAWMHEACLADAGEGERFVDLSGMTPAPEGSAEGYTQAISQTIATTPGKLYHVWFDVAVNPCSGVEGTPGKRSLTVSAAGAAETFTFDPVAEMHWQTRTWRFVAKGQTTTLMFTGQDEPTAGCGVAIDNVCVFLADAAPSLNLTVTGGGKVEVSSEGMGNLVVAGPNSVALSVQPGEAVHLGAKETGGRFSGWSGLALCDPNEGAADIVLRMDQSRSLKAHFGNLVVTIAKVDESECPAVQATVMVAGVNGASVADLNESNFRVYENDALQSAVWVEPGCSCIAACLCLDFSASMKPADIAEMKSAAAQFAGRMVSGQDWGEIIKFAESVETPLPFTDVNSLVDAIEDESGLTGARTLLYKAIHQAIEDTAASTACGCRAVVVLTDGHNNDSNSLPDDVDTIIERAQKTHISVFTIGFGDNVHEATLRRIADETGGVYFHACKPDDPNCTDDLGSVYETVSAMLKNQYIVTYASDHCAAGNDGNAQPCRLTVEIDADTRSGRGVKYFPACPEN